MRLPTTKPQKVKALQGMVDSSLLEGDQLALLVRRLEALEAK